MLTTEEIVNLYLQRQRNLESVHAAAVKIKDIYEGRAQIALPELEKNELPAVANLIQSGIDQHAQRIASSLPTVEFPLERSSQAALDRRVLRRNVVYGWWWKNRLPLMMRRRARDLVGMAMAPVTVRPGPATGKNADIPVWQIRDPLCTFPAPGLNPDDLTPPDCIFTYRRSLRYLQQRYDLTGLAVQTAGPDELFDCLEYLSADQMSVVILGRKPVASSPFGPPATRSTNGGGNISFTVPNYADTPLAIIPGRITMGRLQGQMDQLIGMYVMQAKLWALNYHAVVRGVFGEVWAQGHANEQMTIEQVPDPAQGQIGKIVGGTIQKVSPDAGVPVLQALSQLERNQRLTGAIPAELGGEAASNIRTARRGGQVLSSSIDYPIQEHQEILALSLMEENKAAIAIAKAYHGNKTVSFHVPIGGTRANVTYVANDLYPPLSEEHSVSYAMAGADTNELVIGGGQRIGQGTMSKETFMGIDPMVQDPELEKSRITIEAVRQAGLTSLQQLASNPQGPWQPLQFARLEQIMLGGDVALWDAIQQVDEEARHLQAAQVPPGSPAAQPGLATPGQGMEAGGGQPGEPPPAIGPAGQSSQDLVGILNSLNRPQVIGGQIARRLA